MTRLICAVVLAAVGATFAMDNMHRVALGVIVGQRIHVRLFFLLLTAFLAGCFVTFVTHSYLSIRFSQGSGGSQRDGDEEKFFYS